MFINYAGFISCGDLSVTFAARFKEELSLRRISNPGAPTGENLLSDHRGVKFNVVTVVSAERCSLQKWWPLIPV